MKQRFFKILLRTAGTLIGFTGGAMSFGLLFGIAAGFHDKLTKLDQDVWMLGFVLLIAIFAAAMGLWALRVAYLIWFRFSPKAVRYVCGTLAFGAAIHRWHPLERDTPIDFHGAPILWQPIAGCLCLIALYYGYRIATRYLNRLFFPEVVSGVQV